MKGVLRLTTKSFFRTSVNIKYDIGEPEFLRNYLPTPSHAESIIGTTEGFVNKGANTAHIMIGPYGSGKSLLATVIASIVSKRVDKNIVNELVRKFKNVHQDVHESLDSLRSETRQYIPIVLNGSYPRFGDSIVKLIEKELKHYGIALDLPTERNNIIKNIKNWEEYYYSTFEQFEDLLQERLIDLNSWMKKIEQGNLLEIEWFKSIYPDLTAGAKFDSHANGDLIENLNKTLETLVEKNIGIFIVHDEFGRFLQNLDQYLVYKTMQELQDIAEFVNRSNQYMQLLLISHKGMSQYLHGFNQEHQSEFQRIEKRYTTYFVESDTATYYRIVQQYINNTLKENVVIDTEDIIRQLRLYNLFQELNHHEIENLIVKGCYPIHPVTLFLLPRISKIFGQNERTLFTYLESDDSYGFNNQITKNADYIYADTLFPYFFSEESLKELLDESNKDTIQTYQMICSNLDARKVNAHRIIMFITMWEITNSNSIYKVDNSLLEFATGIDEIRLQEILDELTELKFIRYNRIQNKWELSQGSSVVVEELVQNKKVELKINNEKRISSLTKFLPTKYYLARDYNDLKNITRFMRVTLLQGEQLLKNGLNEKQLMLNDTDGMICLILIENINTLEDITSLIKKVKKTNLIFGVLKNELTMIKDDIDNLMAITELIKDKSILSEYKNLHTELNIIKTDYQHNIDSFLNSFTEFEPNVDWYNKGEKISLINEVELESKVSEIMWDLYGSTPTVMNDSINRFNVVGIQKRSLYKVTDHILSTFHEENIGIKGQGPDYLIYATVLKNNGLDKKELKDLDNEIFLSIRKGLLNYLRKNNSGKLSSLYNILNGSPYGIRPPLIPLIMVVLLRDRWDQLMFYRNNIFVPAIEGEKIYHMFNEAEHYDYVYHDLEEEKLKFMNKLEEEVQGYISDYVTDDTQLIRISSGLLNWLRNLPRHVQITNRLNDRLLKFKEIIRKSEVNPLQGLEELVTLVSNDHNKIKTFMNKLESVYSQFKNEVTYVLLDQLNVESIVEAQSKVQEVVDERDYKNRNRLISTLLTTNDIEEFALNYMGTKLTDWSDINYDLFIKQLNQDIKLFTSTSLKDGEDIKGKIELYIDQDYKQIKKVDLSKKSELVYNNVNRIINNAGRNIPKEEINFIIFKLINKYIE